MIVCPTARISVQIIDDDRSNYPYRARAAQSEDRRIVGMKALPPM